MKKAFIETNTVKLTGMSFMGSENWPSWELHYCRKSSLNFIAQTHKALRTSSMSSFKIDFLLSLFQSRLPVQPCLLLHLFSFQSTISTFQLPLKCISCFPWVLHASFFFSSCIWLTFLFLSVPQFKVFKTRMLSVYFFFSLI